MSRWDALRPNNQEGRARNAASSRRYGAKKAENDGKNVTLSNRSTGSAKSIVVTRIEKCESLSRYEGLRDHILHQRTLTQSWYDVDEVAIASIARHIEENLNVLPAEQVASESLLQIVLPIMMDGRSNADSYRMLCSSICSMMGNPQFASAILAPTVKEIDADGVETLSVNPVRRLLFSALQEELLRPVQECRRETNEQRTQCSKTLWSCRTLSTTLRASIKVDGDRRLTDTNGVSATVISSFFTSVSSRHAVFEEAQGVVLVEESLKLLNSYMIVHPDASKHFVTLLLLPENSMSKSSICTCCKLEKSSELLTLLHQGNREARLFIIGLIQNLPLGSWLKRDNHASPLRSTLSFPYRIMSSLQNLLRITDCLLSRTQDTMDEQTVTLAVTLLMRIPVDQAPSLEPDLLNLMNSLALAMERAFDGSSCSTREVEMFLQLTGGRVTPEGDTTKMSDAMRTWLDSPQGHSLMHRFLSCMKQQGCGRSRQRHRAVCAILRSHPKLVSTDPSLWTAFCGTFDSYFSENNLGGEKEGIELYESILQGRSQAVALEGEAMWQIELEPLQFRISNIVIDGSFASKVGASAALSHLLPQDWVKTGTQSSARYLDFVASLIVDGTPTARSELFKALGKVVSNFYHPLRTQSLSSSSVHEETELCERLISVTLEGCVDPSPNVRCMALFGLGNLCSSLCLLPETLVLTRDTGVDRMALYACRCLADEDIKVKGNAIRSVAHALCLVHRNVASAGEGRVKHCSNVFRDTFAALARQAQHTLALLDPERLAALTWKERQALKKLGWGAFNSLSRMFDAGVAQGSEVSQSVNEVLLVLVQCVARLADLPDKVSLAAGACLLSALSNGGATVARLIRTKEQQGGAIGACTWSCISLLSSDSDQASGPGKASRFTVINHPKLHLEAEALLKVLLEHCSTSDAAFVLTRMVDAQDTDRLRWLCDWMDSHGSSPQAYASFALALDSSSGVGSSSIDPDVEARFAVRAMTIGVDHEEECEGEI